VASAKKSAPPVSIEIAPTEAKVVDRLPSETGWQFEPKWDGFRCLAFRIRLWPSIATAISLLLTPAAFAGIGAEVNGIRARGCEGRPGLNTSLRTSRALDEVAREWSRGGRLRDAIKRTGYRAVNSSSTHVQGAKNDTAILRILAEEYCDLVLDPTFTEMGVHKKGDETWIVLAKPFGTPKVGNAAEVGERALALVNAARARSRKCGNVAYAPAPPLKLAPLLEIAARAHANDMAQHSSFDHVGADGSRPADRVTRTGYRWRTVGENIAAGSSEVDAVVEGWLDSPGHCSNIMGPQFKEMGIAYAVNPESKAHIYWAQVFATPR